MTPNNPNVAAHSKEGKRSIRNVNPVLYCGMENDEIAVKATTMTKTGLTIPACKQLPQ